MQIMVLCDDYWHPASTAKQGLAPLAEQGYEFEWVTDARELPAKLVDSLPVMILVKSHDASAAHDRPWLTPELEAGSCPTCAAGAGCS
jgi:hypothetical protein